jgi:hypothetical protein
MRQMLNTKVQRFNMYLWHHIINSNIIINITFWLTLFHVNKRLLKLILYDPLVKL